MGESFWRHAVENYLNARMSGEGPFERLEHVKARNWSCLRVSGGMRVKVLKRTRVRSGQDTGLESRRCTRKNLELCESFRRRTIENSQVQERLVIVTLKVSKAHDVELKCSHSIQNFQLCNSATFNSTLQSTRYVCVLHCQGDSLTFRM